MDISYPQGATPLDPDEAAGLLPTHITTQADLNAWEETNILQGQQWAARQTKRDLLTEGFVRDLQALHAADLGSMDALTVFARS
jgi:fido (protein-threonine AMPylation protein)